MKHLREKNNIDKNLPNAQAAMNMWKKLDKEAEKLVKSENKKEALENKTTTTTLNLKKIINENKQENKQQQTNKNLTTTTKNLKTKTTIKTEQDANRKQDKQAKPNSKITVKGKQISDLGTLRDFLARKKLERAERGIQKTDASHSQRPSFIQSRDQPTNTGESEKPPNQTTEGLESAARGTTVSEVTSIIGQNNPDEM